ncbi:MAG: efflux transporter outer membrane subunit [Burkholderiales bacterium]|nr:efflux transporter outer membrane subunit [Burkholderiales bacterium]
MRYETTLRRSVTPLLLALALAGCATVPKLDANSTPHVPNTFKEADSQWTKLPAAAAQPQGEWWKVFADPTLDNLIARADRDNLSIQAASARLSQARALFKQTDAERSLHVDASAGAVRQEGDNTALGSHNAAGQPEPGSLGQVTLNASYEMDLFGKLAGASNAAALDANSKEALLASTRLIVQTDVAQTYFALRALDAERTLVRDTVKAYRGTQAVTERLYREGEVAELDFQRIQAQVAETESQALELDQRRATLEHALAVLVGEAASDFKLDEAGWDGTLPVIPAGVPSTVLARRPDVLAAESDLLAAETRVGVAKTAWFPSLTLTSYGGYASSQLHDFFRWPLRAWGIGALADLPIFDGGRRTAGINYADAQAGESLAHYREHVLTAFRDVEDQLSTLRILGQQSDVQARAVAASSRATVLSDSRYRNGQVSQLDLLDAQRNELSDRRLAVQVRSQQYQSTIALIRALGGSWS